MSQLGMDFNNCHVNLEKFDHRLESLHFRSYIFHTQSSPYAIEGKVFTGGPPSFTSQTESGSGMSDDDPISDSNKKEQQQTPIGRKKQTCSSNSNQPRNYFITTFFNDSPTQIELTKLNKIFQGCNGRMPSRRKLQEYSRQTNISQSRIKKWIINKSQEHLNDKSSGNSVKPCERCGLSGMTESEKAKLSEISSKTSEINDRLTVMEENVAEIKDLIAEIEKFSLVQPPRYNNKEDKDDREYWVHLKTEYTF